MPKALGRLFAFIRMVNRLLNSGELDADQARQVLDFMRQVNTVLDVIDFHREESDDQISNLIEARNSARQKKDFPKADALRRTPIPWRPSDQCARRHHVEKECP